MSLYKGNNLISGAMPNSANQSLSNLDSAGQDKFDAKVNKSGDTMTGNLTIRKSYPNFKAENTDIKRGQTPSADYYSDTFMLTDIDGNGMGSLSQTYFTSGKHTTRLWQRGANSEVYSVLDVGMDKNDVPYCSFPNTTCCDGQWVPLGQTIISSSTSLKGSSNLSYTVNIPSSGGYYEVLIYGEVETNKTSGNGVTGKVYGDTTGTAGIGRCKTQTAASVNSSGSGTVVVHSSTRKIILARSNNWEGYCTYLTAIAYRRVGTNA